MATIRMLTPADYPAVAALADAAARRALVGRPLWETAADVAAEVESLTNGALIVAEAEDGTVAGVCGYRLRPSGEAELYGPLVGDEGHGVGAWLESRAVSMAEQQGAAAYSMLVGLANQAGAAWAQWRGYLRDTEEPERQLTWLYPGELQPAGEPGLVQTPGEPGAVKTAGNVVVRPAAATDLPRLEAIFAECFPREQPGPQAWLTSAWVVEAGGRVEGLLRLDKPAAWIEYLCVDPGARRRGLGTTLLAGAVQQFWAEDPRKVGLAVPLDDAAPVSLFRRLGFRREVPVAKWMKR